MIQESNQTHIFYFSHTLLVLDTLNLLYPNQWNESQGKLRTLVPYRAAGNLSPDTRTPQPVDRILERTGRRINAVIFPGIDTADGQLIVMQCSVERNTWFKGCP